MKRIARLVRAGLPAVCAAALLGPADPGSAAGLQREPARGYTLEEPQMTCPAPLGPGAASGRMYCDVMTGRDPAAGVLITLPPHRGNVKLTFDLHARHTYSAEQEAANRAFARYTSVIGVLAMDNTLISRAAIETEFRRESDLVERIAGGAGPSGLKAVAPTGTEHITIEIPQREDQVSILGERLVVLRADGTATYTSPDRPIAVISNVMIEYRPAPGRRTRP
jgi:hypothetical protein